MSRTIATACLLATICVGVLGQNPTPQNPAPPSASQPPAASVGEGQTKGQAPGNKLSSAQQSSLRHKKVPVKIAPPPPSPAAAPATPAPPAPPPAAQLAPPVPATLMNQPPVAPTVTLQAGRLMIDAPNSVLGDVLSQVSKATGAVLEGPAAGERIAVRLGPGEPRQVIAALLQGTPYDYLILGSEAQPDAVTRIVLTAASGSPATPPGAAGAPPPAIGQPQPPEPPSDEGSVVTGTVIESEQPQPPVQQPPPQQPSPPQLAPNSPEALFRALQPGNQPQPQPPQPPQPPQQ